MIVHLVTEQLPIQNQYVLIHVPDRPWGDSDAKQDEHKWVVAKYVAGISAADRAAMKAGTMTNPLEYGHQRSSIYKAEDEHANNKKAYCWQPFGPDNMFGQEVTQWCELPQRR
jgi:hypothetical protein